MKPMSTVYKTALKYGRIHIPNKKLVLYKPILVNNIFVALIIVPTYLRQKIFSHFHAGPNGGHMGEYKTLYRIRLFLSWPGLREDVKKLVKGCAHYISYHFWRNRKQELHFSWPVKIPFYIVHTDICSPVNALHRNKYG